jgi:glycosyltransferase involved in cell wall biosynthesis
MKVLFITPQLPWPLDQGARIRNYYLLRALASQHTVDLLSLDAGSPFRAGDQRASEDLSNAAAPEAAARQALEPYCRRLAVFAAPRRGSRARLRALLRSPLPDLVHRAWLPALATCAHTLANRERYDVVQISSLEMTPYRHCVRDAPSPAPRTVFDNLNAEYRLQWRALTTDLRTPRRLHAALYSAVQWQRLRRHEARVCREVDAVVAVSDTDAALLRALAPSGHYTVLPNGVDTAAFPYHPAAATAGSDPDGGVVLFTGTMDFRPNVDAVLWFVERILPRLRRARPRLRFQVVGKAPHPRLLAAARRHAGLEIVGAVPDMRPFLADATVYTVPMRMGSGVRLKVLEAMAAGVPVVSTTVGLEGIAATPDEHALLADEPAAFAAAIVRLLDDPAERARLAWHARALVEARYDWGQLAPTLLALYGTLERLEISRSAQSLPLE